MGTRVDCPLPRMLREIGEEKEKGAEGMRRKSGSEIFKDGGGIVKKEKAVNLTERKKMYKELAISAREAGRYLEEERQCGGAMEIKKWWSGANKRGIICIIWLSSMRGKPSGLLINSMSSSVPRICLWTCIQIGGTW